MKSCNLVIAALSALKRNFRCISQLAEYLHIGFNPAMFMVNELHASGLIVKTGRYVKRGTGNGAPIYRFKGGEAKIVGRLHTVQVLKVWNALQDPSSMEQVAEDVDGILRTISRHVVNLYKAGLCRIADWQRNPRGSPTALFVHGAAEDAPRPLPGTEKDYNDAAARRRKQRFMFGALTAVA